MSKLNDVSLEIIKKAMDGDNAAFTDIYQAYSKRVYFMAVQYFRNEETAKDIVQEVFIKVHQQIDKLKNPEAFSSWLHVTTYRVCQNYNRRKLKVFHLNEHEQIEDFEDIHQIDIVKKIEDERIKLIIMESLDTLDESLRMIAVLRFFEELKLSEIASVLNIPRTTVSSRLLQVKKHLRADLMKKGIHKKSVLSLVSPALVFEAYQTLYNSYSIHPETSNQILQKILSGGTTITIGGLSLGGASLLTKGIITGVLSLSLIGGVALWNPSTSKTLPKITFHSPKIEVPKPSVANPIAQISNVAYEQTWRNSSLDIQIETTNDNYDRITLNDIDTLQVNDNGEYSIKLIKDDIVIDEKSITITFFDFISPNATGEERGEQYYLYLSDDYSGIDASSIYYYRNNTLVNDYIYDANSQMIIIKNDISSLHELYVSDLAGNELFIELKPD